MMEQESVIANVELRNAFSLHCLHLETQLVHAHLEILAAVLGTLVAVQIRGHSEVGITVKQWYDLNIKLRKILNGGVLTLKLSMK
jgi:sorting nexin-8